MFLSTINRLREEQEKSNSLIVFGRANAENTKIISVGGEASGVKSGGKKGIKRTIRDSRKPNIRNNKLTGINNEDPNVSNISRKKSQNKVGNESKERSISSFQQILNIAMTSTNIAKSLDLKPIPNKKFHSKNHIPPCSYYDSLPDSPNSSNNCGDHRTIEGSEALGESDNERASPPRINFVRIICNGKINDSEKSSASKSITSKKMRNEKGMKNNSFKTNAGLKNSDLDHVTELSHALKLTRTKDTVRKEDDKTQKTHERVLNNTEEGMGKDKCQDNCKRKENHGKKKETERKPKKQGNNIPKENVEEDMERNSGQKKNIQDLEEKPEIYKQNILTLKAKNNIIKKRFKEQTDDDFFNNILISTPSNSNSRKSRKSLNVEQSPSLSIFSPDNLDVKLLKTGLTPINNLNQGSSCRTSDNKASKRKETIKKRLESLHLSPLNSCLKEFTSGEDSNRNSSYSKSSATKSIGDILGGLGNTIGSKSGRLGKLSFEKQNKFIMQLHEKLTSENINDENKFEQKLHSQRKNTLAGNDKFKAAKGSLDLKLNIDSVLDQEMEFKSKAADQEKQQELLWSITEDSSIQNEDRNLLMEELIAFNSHQ